jgi:D-alanyl-lipoteichoic acid acyltransferase DltB (MBOAT superfamily)
MGVSLVWNLGTLGFFKYSNFFIDSVRVAAEKIGWSISLPVLKIILPVGISFFTFKTLSYTLDIYRKQLKPTRELLAYMTYVSFFPQLLSGPIDRASSLLPQLLGDRHFNYEEAVDGCRQIVVGLFKKMALADNLSPIVDQVYATAANAPGPHLIFATVCFAFQIYFDFSAYSDIAIGSAKLLGIRSMQNFAYPYFAESMGEFWRRWHISLTSWFRDYVYFSLPGVRGSALRRSVNVVITFLLSGLWHGASWNFIIWGGLNGLAVTPELFKRKTARRTPQSQEKLLPTLQAMIRMLRTFAVVCFIWIFFRAQTISQAMSIYRRIVTGLLNVRAYLSMRSLLAYSPIENRIVLLVGAFLLWEWIERKRQHPLNLDRWPRPVRWAAYTILLLVTLRYGHHATGDFVYFRF